MIQFRIDGVWRLYRVYPENHQDPEKRLVAVFAILSGKIHVMEDHDGVLEEMGIEGPVTEQVERRLGSMTQSAYWKLVNEKELEQGHVPELLEED
jgi:hypothetical protein